MKPFGILPDETPVHLIPLKNGDMTAEILTYGATVRSLTVPGADGKPLDVVLGYDTLEDYVNHNVFFGALIGPFGNRIGGAKFTLGGKTYALAVNDGPNNLHSGPLGFDRKVWEILSAGTSFVTLGVCHEDGEGGFPGKLQVRVTYRLEPDGLAIEYQAITDKDTLCNLTNHSYFNLASQGEGTILDHAICLNADFYTPTDRGSIPTGEVAKVEGTPMDLREPTVIGDHIDDAFDQLTWAGGYDHNWVLKGEAGCLRPIASVRCPRTGLTMTVESDQPAVQFYAGNYIPDGMPGKQGKTYLRRGGLCLETQTFPDAPNHPHFPTATLRKGETYRRKTVYRFSR